MKFQSCKASLLGKGCAGVETAEIGMKQDNAVTGECKDGGRMTKERNGTKMFWQSKAKKENKAVKQDAR